jgi:hypothetical protein
MQSSDDMRDDMRADRRSRHPRRLAGGRTLVLVAAIAFGCGDDDGGGSVATTATTSAPTADSSDPQVPGWIQRVHPVPGASETAERAVTVNTRTLSPTEEVRLLIDDVDVTSQALVGEPSDDGQDDRTPTFNGRLRYDPREPPRAVGGAAAG